MTYVLAIGTRKGLWLARSEDRKTWDVGQPHLLGQEVAAVTVTPTGRVLAGTLDFHWGPGVQWSDDQGATWEETARAAIAFPEETDTALGRVWQLAPDPRRPGTVWAGCEPHSLWRSDDDGGHFTLVQGLWDHPHRPTWGPGFGGAAIHTVLPEPDTDRVVVAMSTGGVYASDDGATGWTPHNNALEVVFGPDKFPEYGQCVHKVSRDADGGLLLQNHGGVYRSEDRARTWTSVAEGLPSDFGFVSLSSPRVGGTGWVIPIGEGMARVPVGGALATYKTTDGGSSWTSQPIAGGVWNGVLRDAACVDQADPTGVFLGTRDGEVWGSPDEGASWVKVATGLPDVLVVRAAVL